MTHSMPTPARPKRPTDAQRRQAWEKRIWREYGLKPNDVALMWGEQAGLCPICEQELSEKRWVIDHEHVVGFRKLPPELRSDYVRGIVCSYCNRYAIGGCERSGMLRIFNVLHYLDWAQGFGL